MLPNLKAEMMRQNLTYKTVGAEIGKKSEWIENRIQGKASMPVGEALKIRSRFFPKLPFEYLFSDEIILPNFKEEN